MTPRAMSRQRAKALSMSDQSLQKPIDSSEFETAPESLERALGQVVFRLREQWQREREVMDAQRGQFMAEMRAQVIEFRATLSELVTLARPVLRGRMAAMASKVKRARPARKARPASAATKEIWALRASRGRKAPPVTLATPDNPALKVLPELLVIRELLARRGK